MLMPKCTDVSEGELLNKLNSLKLDIPVIAVITAAGSGKRMGRANGKQDLLLRGIPVLTRTIKAFEKHSAVDEIVVTLNPSTLKQVQASTIDNYNFKKIASVIPGGISRSESVFNALKFLLNNGRAENAVVLIHDGARPLVSEFVITDIIEAAVNHGAAIPVLNLKDTVKMIDGNGFVIKTPARSSMRAVQTPQGFRLKNLHDAYEQVINANVSVTDDASVLEYTEQAVFTVSGDSENIKITTPSDITVANSFIDMKISKKEK